MNCRKCGFQLNSNSKFCPNCGAMVGDNNSQVESFQNFGNVENNQQVNENASLNVGFNSVNNSVSNTLKIGNYNVSKKIVYVVGCLLILLLLVVGVKKCSGSLVNDNGYTAGVGSTLKVKGGYTEFNIKATSSLEKTQISSVFEKKDALKLGVFVENKTSKEQSVGGLTAIYKLTDSNKNVMYDSSLIIVDDSIVDNIGDASNSRLLAKQSKNLSIYFDSSDSDKDFSRINDVTYLRVSVVKDVKTINDGKTLSTDDKYYYLKLK